MASIFALAAVGLSIAGGCTLALDHPGTITDTCRFDGADDTQCGRCVRDSCGAQLRACCGDASCQDTLGALDDCAGGADQAACGQVREDPTLGACVTASCKDECRGEGGGSCIDLDTSCTCNDLAPSDTATCSETKVGGGICCADLGWPGSGLRCDCSAFRCKETSDGCSCSTYDDGPLTSCSGTPLLPFLEHL